MRALLGRFFVAEQGSAVVTYLLFTGCWAAIIAIGLQFATPGMTTKLDAVSAAMRGGHSLNLSYPR